MEPALLASASRQLRGDAIVEEDRFDAWTVAIASIASRRAALRAAVAGAIAPGLVAFRVRRASALEDDHDKCSQDADCDTGLCFKSGTCKQDGRLTGKCRCACDVVGLDCPAGKVCCNVGEGIRRCLVGPGGACKFDTDCCYTVCRNNRCCRALGGACVVDSDCCSGNCPGSFCAPA
jgi:hypothetical protein